MELESPVSKPFISIAVYVSMPKTRGKASQETGCLHSFRAAQHNSLLITNGEQLESDWCSYNNSETNPLVCHLWGHLGSNMSLLSSSKFCITWINHQAICHKFKYLKPAK